MLLLINAEFESQICMIKRNDGKMKKEPREEVLNFIDRKIAKERDKFMSGMKSDYYEWKAYKDEFIDTYMELVTINDELTIMTRYLQEKQLFREYQNYKDSYVHEKRRIQ